jgi:hypothetical protein
MSLCCGSRSWSWGTVRCGLLVNRVQNSVVVHKVLRGRKSLIVGLLANIRNRMHKTTIQILNGSDEGVISLWITRFLNFVHSPIF